MRSMMLVLLVCSVAAAGDVKGFIRDAKTKAPVVATYITGISAHDPVTKNFIGGGHVEDGRYFLSWDSTQVSGSVVRVTVGTKSGIQIFFMADQLGNRFDLFIDVRDGD